ncbi:NTP transferase domain-containing protein [bacterium]|nr:NTP transferase domain-containing protein [bacterium]
MTNQQRKTIAVILAAGKGTRMKTTLPKVLHPLLGKPLVLYVTKAVKNAGIDDIILVVGYKSEMVINELGTDYRYVLQKQQLGTGHALMIASEELKEFHGDLLVLVGDAPFLTPDIIKKLVLRHRETGASATMMTAIMDPPPAYGRIVRDKDGKVIRIVEERDATPEEKKITEVNTSHYCFRSEDVLPLLNSLGTNNDQGEYYLTDIIEFLTGKGALVETLPETDPDVLKGINSQEDLTSAVKRIKTDIIKVHMNNGVIFPDPDSVYIEESVSIKEGTIIHPFTYISGSTTIGSFCEIGPFATIKNAAVGNQCRILHSIIYGIELKDSSKPEPFSHLSKD